LLVLANLAWSVACVLMVAACFAAASALGLSYLLAEAAFVGGLAYLEWRAAGAYGAAS